MPVVSKIRIVLAVLGLTVSGTLQAQSSETLTGVVRQEFEPALSQGSSQGSEALLDLAVNQKIMETLRHLSALEWLPYVQKNLHAYVLSYTMVKLETRGQWVTYEVQIRWKKEWEQLLERFRRSGPLSPSEHLYYWIEVVPQVLTASGIPAYPFFSALEAELASEAEESLTPAGTRFEFFPLKNLESMIGSRQVPLETLCGWAPQGFLRVRLTRVSQNRVHYEVSEHSCKHPVDASTPQVYSLDLEFFKIGKVLAEGEREFQASLVDAHLKGQVASANAKAKRLLVTFQLTGLRYAAWKLLDLNLKSLPGTMEVLREIELIGMRGSGPTYQLVTQDWNPGAQQDLKEKLVDSCRVLNQVCRIEQGITTGDESWIVSFVR
jgi:hypothetical protein